MFPAVITQSVWKFEVQFWVRTRIFLFATSAVHPTPSFVSTGSSSRTNFPQLKVNFFSPSCGNAENIWSFAPSTLFAFTICYFTSGATFAFALIKYTDQLRQAVSLLIAIQEATGSNLCRDTGYLVSFSWHSPVSPGRCRNSTSN